MKDSKIYWFAILQNTVSIIAFTVLAIVFNRWWIIFFSILFLNYIKTDKKYYRICDGCGKHSPGRESYNAALDAAKDAGWNHVFGRDEDGIRELDFCPSCLAERDKENSTVR